MSEKIIEMLGAICESQGRIEQKIDSHVKAFDLHLEDDKHAYKAIVSLEKSMARQKGFLTAIGAVSGGIVYAIGWLVEHTFGLHR